MPPQNQQFDPTALTLTKAIAMQEGGGQFLPYTNKSGDEPDAPPGTAGGRYQFTADTWKNYAQQVLGDPNAPMTPENQNKVAYTKVKQWLDSGKTPAQASSMWNAGEGAPDAWKPGTVQKNGDTPDYVKNVQKYAQQLTGGQTSLLQGSQNQPQQDNPLLQQPNDNSALSAKIAALTQGSAQDSSNGGVLSDLSQGKYGAAAGDAVKGVGNFLFPSVADAYHVIKGDNTKTGLQLAGDLGSTALGAATLIPGLDVFAGAGEAAKAAEGATDVAKAAPGLLSSVGKNAALGAGFGVSGALGQGQTDPTKIAESGLLGAGTGGVLGGIGGVLSDKLSAAGTTAEDRLSTQTNRLKTLQKAFADNSRPASAVQAGTDPIGTLSQNDLIKGLKVASGKVDASALTNPQDMGTLDNLIEDHSNQASALVKSMKGGIPLDSFKNEVLRAVANNPAIRDAGDLDRAESEVERRFASYSRSFGDLLPFTAVDGIRTAMNRIYDPAERDVARTIGDTARTYLYNGNGANTALKSLMQNEGELIRAKNFVEKLHGTTVPGGKLHKYIAELIGGAVGAGLGKAVPFGDVVGIPAGAYVGGKLEDMAQSRYFNPSSVGGLLKKATGNNASGTMAGLLKVGALRGASSIVQ